MSGKKYSDRKKEQRLRALERDLIAALKGPRIEISIEQIRKIGLVSALRAQIRK